MTPEQPPIIPSAQPPILQDPGLHPDVDPDQIAHTAMKQVIDKQTQQGSLKVPNTPIPGATTYNVDSFLNYLHMNQADVPPFKGAAVPQGGWFDQASQAIGGTEGFEGRAYWGIYAPERQTHGIFVKPGQVNANTKSEVSIGFGYNLTGNKDSRDVFKKQLGFSDADFDGVLNGTKEITPDEALKLRSLKIYEMNGYLNAYVKVPLQDYQRAALVSMVYNFGPGGFKKTGIPDALNAGKSPQEIAQLILRASPNQPKLQSRRQAEAQLFLGAKNGASMLARTTSNYTQPAQVGDPNDDQS